YIEAAKRDITYGGKSLHYSSGSLNTKGKFDRQYGRYDIRVKMPKGKGLNPSLRLQTESGNFLGLEIFDKLGSVAKPDSTERFHEIIEVWSPDRIDYYVDGKKHTSTLKGFPAKKMFMTLKLAIGGDGAAS